MTDTAYSFGIEEEYFLADALTGRSPDVAAAERFHAAASQQVASVSPELLKGQVEVCTEPGNDFDAAREALAGKRRDLSRLASEHGLSLFAAGSHPLGEPKAQEISDKDRYRRIQAEFGIITSRAMVCAMHIHVEVPHPEARIPIMNRLLPFLPLTLALSVSSPFWQKRDSGLKGFRLTAFSEWPRVGLPEIFPDQAEYQRFVALMVDTGQIPDASFIWWYIRPSTHFPTLELRVCDSCTRVDDSIAIAALYRCLVRAVLRRPDINARTGPLERGVTAENIWQAQREGVTAKFVDTRSGGLKSVAESLDEALDLVAEDAAALGCEAWLARTRTIVERGNSADAQLAVFHEAKAQGGDDAEALAAVVRHLAETTLA